MAEKTSEQFLHQKNPTLHISNLVEREVERQKMRGEEISQKPADKIHTWMDLLQQTHISHRDDPGVLDRIKEFYYKTHVIKQENIPQSYFDNQKKITREQGRGDIEITQEMKQQHAEILISDQKSTFDPWLEYLTSSDSDYIPTWAKYWVFTGMLKLGTYDKQKHAFSNRDKNTVAPFPDLNREALAYVVDKLIKKVDKVNVEDNDPELKKLLASANFGKLYVWAIEKVTLASKENLINTAGKWVKYDQGSDHMSLVISLQGHGTGWCTAGESSAQNQLHNGDFYVYYSHNQNGQATIPRIAIRMNGKDSISEVRGIAENQNLDPYVNQILETKLKEFGQEGDKYKEKNADMKYLTQIDNKQKLEQELSKEELRFLYEIDKKILGFGYDRDPRIKENLEQRNIKKDIAFVLDCQENQISINEEEALSGNIIFHYGDLELRHLTSAEGLILPQSIGGDLDFHSLKSTKGLILPESISGNLYLNFLESAKGLTLPQSIGGDLDLGFLKSAKGLTLSKSIGGGIYLGSLESAEGLILHESIGGNIYLNFLKSTEGLILPKSIGGSLYLGSLKSIKGLILPESISGSLYLNSLSSAEKEKLQNSYPDFKYKFIF